MQIDPLVRFTCPTCLETFASLSVLEKHRVRAHNWRPEPVPYTYSYELDTQSIIVALLRSVGYDDLANEVLARVSGKNASWAEVLVNGATVRVHVRRGEPTLFRKENEHG